MQFTLLGAETAEGFEGSLIRKHTYEAQDRKAASRSWDKLYCVLRGNTLAFYKDHKHKEAQDVYHGEQPINLAGANAQVASDYTKKRFVISLRLPNGAEYLLQARDEVRRVINT